MGVSIILGCLTEKMDMKGAGCVFATKSLLPLRHVGLQDQSPAFWPLRPHQPHLLPTNLFAFKPFANSPKKHISKKTPHIQLHTNRVGRSRALKAKELMNSFPDEVPRHPILHRIVKRGYWFPLLLKKIPPSSAFFSLSKGRYGS